MFGAVQGVSANDEFQPGWLRKHEQNLCLWKIVSRLDLFCLFHTVGHPPWMVGSHGVQQVAFLKTSQGSVSACAWRSFVGQCVLAQFTTWHRNGSVSPASPQARRADKAHDLLGLRDPTISHAGLVLVIRPAGAAQASLLLGRLGPSSRAGSRSRAPWTAVATSVLPPPQPPRRRSSLSICPTPRRPAEVSPRTLHCMS